MTGPAIHILDDDAPFRESLAFMLSAHGFGVTTHGDPLTFLRAFSTAESCCVICDIRMPGISGVEVTRRLRSRGFDAGIILITGHADAALVELASKAGATLLLEKPFPAATLIAVINGLAGDAGVTP